MDITQEKNTDIMFKAYSFQMCLEMSALIQKLSTVSSFAVACYEKIGIDDLEALYNSLVRLGAYHGL